MSYIGELIGLERKLKETTDEKEREEIEKDIADRDYQDMNREVSPLKQAKDAVLLDSSYLDIPQVVAEMKKKIMEKLS